jgi:hypothetical protein
MKIIVYTVNINGYDSLHPSKYDSVDYLYFTDGDAPRGWQKIHFTAKDRKGSRYHKINSHLLPPHDISIYIDACLKIKKPLSELIEHLQNDIAICEHPRSNCVYHHAKMCINLGLDNPKIIKEQMKRYSRQGLPMFQGLTENCLIIRRNNDKIKELNQIWWKEYQRYSQRDQLSLPYALFKTKTKVDILPFNSRDNKYYKNWGNHLKSRKWTSIQ